MSQKHKLIIQKLFSHPMPTNIQWKKLMTTLEHFGVQVEITSANKAKLIKDGHETLLTLPHRGHEFDDKTEISHLKTFLETVSITPETI